MGMGGAIRAATGGNGHKQILLFCQDCGATVEIKEVLNWHAKIAEAFAKLKSRRIH